MMRFIFVALLAGCATTEPHTVEVRVPVAVPCITAAPRTPSLVTDAELNAMSDYQAVLALWVDRIKRGLYESELEAAIIACVARND